MEEEVPDNAYSSFTDLISLSVPIKREPKPTKQENKPSITKK